MAVRVRFDARMMGRLGRLIGRLRALRSRREGRGITRWGGAGDAFAGHRPWQPGEDARHLDWNMLARHDQPFVRVFEREAAERWAVLLDVSDSMDMASDERSKLQLAAETVLGIAALAVEARATLVLVASDGRQIEVARTADQAELMHFLARTEACDVGLDGALGALLASASVRERPGRVFIIGDLDELHTDEVCALAAPGRDLVVLRFLARAELVPTEVFFAGGARVVELEDLESGAQLPATLATARAYERLLGHDLDVWRRVCTRHKLHFGLVEVGSDTTFEDVIDGLVGGGRA